MAWYVYMLRCGDGSLYTGCTDNVARRLAAHQSGKGAKYTRSRPPVSLAYQEELPDKPAALRREAAIKRLTRAQKLKQIEGKDRCVMREMRRKERQITEEEAWAVVDKCEYAFLAMTAEDGTPYGLPVTIVREGRNVYFHSAMEGRKIRCLRQHHFFSPLLYQGKALNFALYYKPFFFILQSVNGNFFISSAHIY